MSDKITFEEWKDQFVSACNALHYTGPIDADSFETEYDIDVTPEEAARDFVKEMEEIEDED